MLRKKKEIKKQEKQHIFSNVKGANFDAKKLLNNKMFNNYRIMFFKLYFLLDIVKSQFVKTLFSWASTKATLIYVLTS